MRSVWVVGEQGYDALTMHWNGNRWSVSDGAHPAAGGLSSVAAISEGNVWAVGAGDALAVEHWNGGAWHFVPAPTETSSGGNDFDSLTDVAAVSSTDIWAVAEYESGNTIRRGFIEHWNGHRWSILRDIDSFGGAVAALSSSDVWLSGKRFAGNALTMHWNGRRWQTLPLPAASMSVMYAIDGVASTEAWAVGAAGKSQQKALIDHFRC